MDKVTVELDLNAIFSATDKYNALYKAVRDDILSRSSTVEELRKRVMDGLVKEQLYAKMKDNVAKELEKYSSPEELKKMVAQKSYEISGVVSKIIQERKDLLETEVLRYMAKSEFQKTIAEVVERNLIARVEHLIAPTPYDGD